MIKGVCCHLYIRHQHIRKVLFLFYFTGTKAHWKQIDPEGLILVLSRRKALLWTEPCIGEAILLWSTCQALAAGFWISLQNDFAAVCFWPALLPISPQLGSSLYFGGIQECFAGAWVAKANGSRGTYPQLSAAAENSNFSSVQGGCLCLFLWTALISLSNCRRRLPLLRSKEIVPKVMGKLDQFITHYFRPTQSNVCFNPLSNPLSVCLQGKGFPDCSDNTHLGMWAHRGGRSVAGQALLGTPWLLSSAAEVFWKSFSAGWASRSGHLLSFGQGFCKSVVGRKPEGQLDVLAVSSATAAGGLKSLAKMR